MEEKKYKLSLSDIQMLIGLGADSVCKKSGLNGTSSDFVTAVAAGIYKKVEDHLTGKCEFTKEQIDTYNLLSELFDKLEMRER